jgi:ubiquitin-conjugating enzyme E2 A
MIYSTSDDCKIAKKRLLKDLLQIQSLTVQDGVTAAPFTESNLFEWQAIITGPDDTPYEGGLYELHLSIPCNYPVNAPKVRFKTDIFHPNIYKNGDICIDILQDQWSEVMSIEKILISIRSLLNDPNVNSPANPEAALLYKEHRHEFYQRIRNDIDKQLNEKFVLLTPLNSHENVLNNS